MSAPSGQKCPDIKDDFLQADLSKSKETATPGKPEAQNWVSEKGLFSKPSLKPAKPSSRKKETSSPVAPAPSSNGWNDPKPVKIEPHRTILKPAAIEKTFRRAYDVENAGISGAMFVRWTEKEMGILNKTILSRWEDTPESCHNMFEWIVRDWFMIRKRLFSWMDRPGKEGAPKLPTISFICRQRAWIVPAWHGNKQAEWVAQIDDVEERRVQKLLLEGHSRDDVFLIIAEERAKEKMREENAKKTAEAAQMLGTARIIQQKLKEQRRWGVDNPHPSSQIAQRLREEQAKAAAPAPNEPIPSLDELMNVPFREE
ncbi:MAG: hypothetical protein AAAB35_14365 [Phyllobacterium sp.]